VNFYHGFKLLVQSPVIPPLTVKPHELARAAFESYVSRGFNQYRER
jgi:hypothetical protein